MTEKYQKHLFVCINERPKDSPRGDCLSCGGMEIRNKFVRLINQNGLKGKVRANKSGCLDVCEEGPAVVIYPDNIWYKYETKDDIDEIITSHIVNDKIVQRLKI